jgi:hypothetical protein
MHFCHIEVVLLSERSGFTFREKWFYFQREVVLLSERSGFTFREKWFYFQRETKGNKKYMHLIPYSIRYGYFHSERNGFSFKEKLKERENVCIKFLTRFDMDISIRREMKGNKKYMHLIPYSIRYGYFHSERNGFSFNEKWFFFQREVVFLSKRNGRREKMYAFNSLLDTIWIFQFKEKWFFFQRKPLLFQEKWLDHICLYEK